MAHKTILENLINEFYHPITTNDRKKQLEVNFLEYKNNQDAWQNSLYSLQNIKNFKIYEHLWFFHASTIEYAILKKWLLFTDEDRILLRSSLWTYYTKSIKIDSPKRQRDTIARLLVLIGKRDYPDENPDFFKNIIDLLKQDCLLGATLLRITSEEIVNTKDDMPFDKKKYFQISLSMHLNDVMHIIGDIFKLSILDLNSYSMSLPDDNLSIILLELLSCVQHLFSWISFDEYITELFLQCIFEIAVWRDRYCEISIAALNVLNELFYVQRSMNLHHVLLEGVKILLRRYTTIKSNELYEDKLTEFLRLYTNKYWSKIMELDKNDQFSLSNLITGFSAYIFNDPLTHGSLAFTEKLEILSPLLRGIILNGGSINYMNIMYTLSDNIFKKMQFRFDKNKDLELLDNEILDDNMETEWQHYLRQCIEMIALIAECCPNTIFDLVFDYWKNSYELFLLNIEKFCIIDNNAIINGSNSCNNDNNGSNYNSKTILIINDQTKCHFIHCLLRDLSSLCQTLIRLISFIHINNENILNNRIYEIKQHLVILLKFFNTKQFQCYNIENTKLLNTDSSELHSQILLALRGLLDYTKIFNNSDIEFKDLIIEVGKILLPSSITTHHSHYHHQQQQQQQQQQESSSKTLVNLAAAQLLLKMANTIRPRYMLECDPILQLMQAGPNLSSHLSKQVIIVIYQMIISCLVLPWPNIENKDQSYDQRNAILNNYITCLANDFLKINDDTNSVIMNGHETKVTEINSLSILTIFKEVLEHFIDSNSAVKQILMNNFKSIIAKSLSVYQSHGFTSTIIAESIFDFLLSVLRCLQVQIGIESIQQMISFFLESFSKAQFTSYQSKILEKILRMLVIVVEQPGSSTMSLIPPILNLALYHALPWLNNDKNLSNDSDASYLLYSLFDVILLHKWQYFYKSQVRRGFSPGASDFSIPNDEQPQNADQLLAILTSYGQVLVNGNDPHLNNIILRSLQNLNDKWKLYNRDFFKDNLLQSFLHAIINLLFSAEGAIYYDLLIHILYSMGQVNVSQLHDAFITLGYKNSKILNEICLSTDLPTFSHKITQYIHETRSIRLTQ